MRASGCIAILGAVLAASVAARPAAAADLLRYSRMPEPVIAPEPVESGWYLRVDATVSDFNKPSDGTPPNATLPPYVGLRLSDAPGYGGGVGYRVNGWLRVDATIDQRNASRFSTRSSASNFVTGYNVEAGDLDVLTGLVNVYADLGTWWGLTPYLGAGLGFADKRFHGNYTQTTCILDACDGAPGTGPRTAVTRPDRSVSTLAWSLTAGVSYPIMPGLSIDAAYRYVDLGRAKSGIDAFGASTRLKDISANEVRVGLRYQFAGGLMPVATSNPYGN